MLLYEHFDHKIHVILTFFPVTIFNFSHFVLLLSLTYSKFCWLIISQCSMTLNKYVWVAKHIFMSIISQTTTTFHNLSSQIFQLGPISCPSGMMSYIRFTYGINVRFHRVKCSFYDNKCLIYSKKCSWYDNKSSFSIYKLSLVIFSDRQ